MGRVCVIVENRIAIDDGFKIYSTNKAVAGNPTIAENLIEEYKNELIRSTYDHGGVATDMTIVGGDVIVIIECHIDNVTYRYEYSWRIEQFDIVES